MDEEDEKLAVFSRHRSPAFNKLEVKTLISLIEKYKVIILNKSTSASASHAKEIIWSKIALKYNKKGFQHDRSVDCLKIKWDNLKKEARKLTKNIIDPRSENDEILNTIVTLMCETDVNICSVEMPDELTEDEDFEDVKDTSNVEKDWGDEVDKPSENSMDEDDNDGKGFERKDRRTSNRSLNFSPQECSLLLRCVREQKKYIFLKDNSSRASKLKKHAWDRVTDVFNRHSPQKRSNKMLRNKFNNMKKLAKRVGVKDYMRDIKMNKKHEKLVEESHDQNIKTEPKFEYKANDVEIQEGNDDDDVDFNDQSVPSPDNHNQHAPDPLCMVLNGDSGLGSFNSDQWNSSENKEVTNLKIQLLNYQMETAKLERKSIEQEIASTSTAKEMRDIESALLLRKARLEMAAAEMKLPSNHPALLYTADEIKAQQYIQNVPTTKFFDRPNSDSLHTELNHLG